MPKGYHHLTYEQRCQIVAFQSSGMNQASIARHLHCAPSTLSRELKRNQGQRGYRHKQAQRLAQMRRSQASLKPRCMTRANIARIETCLKEDWSPEQISGRLKRQGIVISHETIYRHIWRDKHAGGHLYKHLRRQGKKYNKRSSQSSGRGLIPQRVDIDKRPKIVDEKSRIGDWEGDTIIGKNHQGALLTYVDRASKFTVISVLTQKKAKLTTEATLDSFKGLKRVVKTITYDNGKEFSQHQKIAKRLKAKCFFAKPYHSWERGLNEHTNGLIRQYFPKKTNFHHITKEEVRQVMEKINNRPRKVLHYRTPKEVFMAALSQREKIALQG